MTIIPWSCLVLFLHLAIVTIEAKSLEKQRVEGPAERLPVITSMIQSRLKMKGTGKKVSCFRVKSSRKIRCITVRYGRSNIFDAGHNFRKRDTAGSEKRNQMSMTSQLAKRYLNCPNFSNPFCIHAGILLGKRLRREFIIRAYEPLGNQIAKLFCSYDDRLCNVDLRDIETAALGNAGILSRPHLPIQRHKIKNQNGIQAAEELSDKQAKPETATPKETKRTAGTASQLKRQTIKIACRRKKNDKVCRWRPQPAGLVTETNPVKFPVQQRLDDVSVEQMPLF